jgi:hypothetical protein
MDKTITIKSQEFLFRKDYENITKEQYNDLEEAIITLVEDKGFCFSIKEKALIKGKFIKLDLLFHLKELP